MKILKPERMPEHNKPLQEIIRKEAIDNDIKALSGKPKEAIDAANRLIPLVRDPMLKAELKLFAEEKKQWAISREIVKNLKLLRETSDKKAGKYVGYREDYYNGIEKASNTVLKINEKRKMDDMELQEIVRKALA